MSSLQGITEDTEPVVIKSFKMSKDQCKQSDCSNARFGFSLAALDLDLDGYQGDLLLLLICIIIVIKCLANFS